MFNSNNFTYLYSSLSFSSHLKYSTQTLRAFLIALSYESEVNLSKEITQHIIDLRDQITNLIQSTPSTSGVSSIKTLSDGE